MTDIQNGLFEQTLANLEEKINSTLKTASASLNALKKTRAAARTGNLRDLTKTLEAAKLSISTLQQQFDETSASWAFNGEEYAAGQDYVQEIIAQARALGVEVYEQDGLLYSYPVLLRVVPGELSVQIDKTKDRRLRPSAVAAHLKLLQNKPVRFRPEAFLESLYTAYSILAKKDDQVVSLKEVYELLTLLPGQSKEYSRQEFARDVYLLDCSGVNRTRGGRSLRLPASTGTKVSRGAMRVVTPEGREARYYGISFSG